MRGGTAITPGRQHREGRAGHTETGNHHSEKAIGNSIWVFNLKVERGQELGGWGEGGGEGGRDGKREDFETERAGAQRERREPETRARRQRHIEPEGRWKERRKSKAQDARRPPTHTLKLAHTHTPTYSHTLFLSIQRPGF